MQIRCCFVRYIESSQSKLNDAELSWIGIDIAGIIRRKNCD